MSIREDLVFPQQPEISGEDPFSPCLICIVVIRPARYLHWLGRSLPEGLGFD